MMAGRRVAAGDEPGRQVPAAVGALPPVVPVAGRTEAEAAGRRRLRAVAIVRSALATQPPNDCQVLGEVGTGLRERGRAPRASARACAHEHTGAATGRADRRRPKHPATARRAARPTSKQAGGHGR